MNQPPTAVGCIKGMVLLDPLLAMYERTTEWVLLQEFLSPPVPQPRHDRVAVLTSISFKERMMERLLATTALLSVLLACVALAQDRSASGDPPQLGKASIKQVIAAMTNEEKAKLLVGM